MQNQNSSNADYLIVGGGIVGLALARELLERKWGSVRVLEKEPDIGVHSSGRNSGVLHAGFYYSSESVKAKVCADGARKLFEYAESRGIRVARTGKVVVPPVDSAEMDKAMDLLLQRAQRNGIELRNIDQKQLLEIEPFARPAPRALFSPNTAVIDSKAVLAELRREVGNVEFGAQVCAVDFARGVASTTDGRKFGFGRLINAAGLHADTISKLAGIGTHYRLLPFKGIYRKLRPEAAQRFRGSIYPVPDLNLPFLGVHVTRNIDGDVYLGPTAIPAFGRENYYGAKGVRAADAASISLSLSSMILRNSQNMRHYVVQEMRKYGRRSFLRDVQTIAPSIREEDMTETRKVGLRPQLFDVRTQKLEMDFVVEHGPRSTHILNAISPGFTSSFAFAKWVLDQEPGVVGSRG